MMRAGYDAATKWPKFPAWDGAGLERGNWRARAVLGLKQTLVSGDLAGARGKLPRPFAETGLWAVATGPDVIVRAARDRALLVSPDKIPLTPGWHGEGWAVSPADGGFAVFELSGIGVEELVREAVSADLGAASPSAASFFAGVACLLYRTAPEIALLHVETALGPFVWRWLEARA